MARAKSFPTIVALFPGRLVAAVATSPASENLFRTGNNFNSRRVLSECASGCHGPLARGAIHVAMLRAVEFAAVLALSSRPVVTDMADHLRGLCGSLPSLVIEPTETIRASSIDNITVTAFIS
jgi:hypothetical protein